jgi:hypothetical protein
VLIASSQRFGRNLQGCRFAVQYNFKPTSSAFVRHDGFFVLALLTLFIPRGSMHIWASFCGLIVIAAQKENPFLPADQYQ